MQPTRECSGSLLTAKLALMLAAAIMMFGFGAQSASGQAFSQTYGKDSYRTRALMRPPTISPYLELLRNDGGVLPNYHQFVRPRVRIQEELVTQSRAIDSEARRLERVNRNVRQLEQQQINATTGVRATFFNYSHFYPGMGQR